MNCYSFFIVVFMINLGIFTKVINVVLCYIYRFELYWLHNLYLLWDGGLKLVISI